MFDSGIGSHGLFLVWVLLVNATRVDMLSKLMFSRIY